MHIPRHRRHAYRLGGYEPVNLFEGFKVAAGCELYIRSMISLLLREASTLTKAEVEANPLECTADPPHGAILCPLFSSRDAGHRGTLTPSSRQCATWSSRPVLDPPTNFERKYSSP